MFTKQDLTWLARHTNDTCCVSIFMPTYSQAHDVKQDTIRFKNLLQDARGEMSERGLRKPVIDDMLAPADRLIAEESFWRKHSDGLAVFITPEEFRWYRTPIELESEVIVSRHFHIAPLISALNHESRYFVLALSQKEARLLDGGPDGTSRIELPKASEGVEGTVGYDAPRKEVQFHTGTGAPAGGGRRAAVFHGSGGVVEKDKELIEQYFRIIDKDVSEALKGQKAPLILAGVEYLFPIYRQVNSYPNLLEGGIEGNPDDKSDKELGQSAWERLQPHLRESVDKSLNQLKELVGTERASVDVQDIVNAVIQSKVRTLVVARDAHCWGEVDETGKATVHEERQEGDRDLLDLCALKTLARGQNVYAVEQERMPQGATMGAIFAW